MTILIFNPSARMTALIRRHYLTICYMTALLRRHYLTILIEVCYMTALIILLHDSPIVTELQDSAAAKKETTAEDRLFISAYKSFNMIFAPNNDSSVLTQLQK